MLQVEHVPTLRDQQRIYAIPRGPGRFADYIATITGGVPDACVMPPLISMNPMAREHVAEAVDRLIALDAEAVARDATAEACARLSAAPIDLSLKIGLVVLDDLKGGWTDRRFIELAYRLPRGKAVSTFGWLTAGLWVTEPTSPEGVRATVLSTIYRCAHRHRFGNPSTLREVFLLEGRAACFAGSVGTGLDPDDLAYSREVVAPWLDTDDVPRQFACLFGDAAARSVGYDPLGLSPRAGFALATEDARRAGVSPEAALVGAMSTSA